MSDPNTAATQRARSRGCSNSKASVVFCLAKEEGKIYLREKTGFCFGKNTGLFGYAEENSRADSRMDKLRQEEINGCAY